MKVLSASFKSRAAVIAMALATVTAGAAPAFAWGAGAPDSAYSVYYDSHNSAPVHARRGARAYYDYAGRQPVAPGYAGRQRVVPGPQQYQEDEPDYNGLPVGGWW